MHIRLIAINDSYDSNNPRTDSSDILIPFKNLINEQYLRDFSVKIRSSLNIKRKNGEFTAAFAPYGYTRDAGSKHQLVADKYAARVVQDIFRWKLGGMSQKGIADKLNEIGEPSPAEYKKLIGIPYMAAFQTHAQMLWSAQAVGRILSNPVYLGILVQGKETTPNYKVKKRIKKTEAEWYTVKDTHVTYLQRSIISRKNQFIITKTDLYGYIKWI